MKKVSRLLISVMLMIGALSVVVQAHGPVDTREVIDQGSSWSLTWKLFADGELHFYGSGLMENYKRGPLGTNGLPEWYKNKEQIHSVVLEPGIKNIGNYAFYGCSNLTNVIIPEGVTSIGESAFSWCVLLDNVKLPNSLEAIGVGAFCACSKLTEINVPEHVTAISSSVFSSCSNLRKISLPDGLNSIGSSVFSQCKSLVSIRIPGKITSLDGYTFYECTALKSVTLSPMTTIIGAWSFYGCDSFEKFIFTGTEQQWQEIYFEGRNEPALSAVVQFDNGIPAEEIQFSQDVYTFIWDREDPDSALQLFPVIQPSNSKTPLEWTSDNPQVAKIRQDGTIIPIGDGIVRISVETCEGVSDSACVVILQNSPIYISRVRIDQKITNEIPKGPFELEVSVGNKKMWMESAAVLIATYDIDGRMIDVQSAATEIPGGTAVTVSKKFLNQEKRIDSIKVFVVNNEDDVIPQTSSYLIADGRSTENAG